jgi:hypothetical protein
LSAKGKPVAEAKSLDDFIDAAAEALELPIDAGWKAAVHGHLEVILRHGMQVAEFALPDESEPAPVFKA